MPDRRIRWPWLLVLAGLAMFWLACINSERLPFETVLVGPGIMVAGVIISVLSRRRTARAPRSASSV
jgi:hypothetical protein